jgi:glutaredoxin 3
MNITIYTKSNCPNCIEAKRLLERHKLRHIAISLDDPNALAQFVTENPGVRQMPQIYFNDQRVGGLAGLKAAMVQAKIVEAP